MADALLTQCNYWCCTAVWCSELLVDIYNNIQW